MKKPVSAVITLSLMICLAVSAYAASYEDILDAYDAWSSDGYPDWVSTVYEDSDGISVVVTSEKGENRLLNMLDDTSSLTVYVDEDAIPHSELEQVYGDILGTYYMGEDDSPVVSLALGWITDENGDLIGFGSTGLESRVIVGVLSDSLEEYEELFEEAYGDAVYVVDSETLGGEDGIEVIEEESSLTSVDTEETEDVDVESEESSVEESEEGTEEEVSETSGNEDSEEDGDSEDEDEESETVVTTDEDLTTMSPAEWVVGIIMIACAVLVYYVTQRKE